MKTKRISLTKHRTLRSVQYTIVFVVDETLWNMIESMVSEVSVHGSDTGYIP